MDRLYSGAVKRIPTQQSRNPEPDRSASTKWKTVAVSH